MTQVANIGDVIAGRYRIEGVLGTGGMGAVFDAAQLGLNRRVALKLMHPQVGLEPESRARFEREARVSAALHHPGAVKIFDYGEDAGRLYIVMERLEGTSLRSFVNDDLPVMPLPRTLDIARQVADVLIAAHDMGLVHRDLKPENIFLEKKLDGTDRAVVVDFGLAFIDQREDVARMTQAGMLMGTPAYIAPEQVGGLHVGPPADMYSFGCMLYEMVTALTPFDGNAMMMLPKHLFEAPVPPSRRRNDTYIPRALEELILRLLAKRAEDRPQARGVSEVLAQLALTLGDRERARGREALDGRAARMIPTVRGPMDPVPGAGAPMAPSAPMVADGGIVVALAGSVPDAIALGLRANGYTLVPVVDSLPAGAAAVYLATTDRAWVEAAVQTGLPVLVEMNADDVHGVSAMMAMGVADVIPQPVRVEQAATKLARALRRSQRRRSS
jgi:serine/threonine-protein kinase